MDPTGRELIMYPRMVPSPEDPDPCITPSMSYYHLLNCGHVIATPTPDEPCGKTCHNVARSIDTPTFNSEAYSRAPFHCKACNEEEIKAHILRRLQNVVWRTSASASAHAHAHSVELRQEYENEAEKKRERKSYISAKVVSVPCDPWNGLPTLGYRPAPGHPLDTANPPAGANMFEDIPQTIPQEEAEIPQVLERPAAPGTCVTPQNEEDGEEGEELIVEKIFGDRDRLGERIYHVKYCGIEEGGDWLTAEQLNKYEKMLSLYQGKIRPQRETDSTDHESTNSPREQDKTPETRSERSQGLSTPDSRPLASTSEILDSPDAQGRTQTKNINAAKVVRKAKKLEKIVGYHMIKTRGFKAYRVKWVGCEAEEWVSEKELAAFTNMVEEYHSGQPN